jgi:hypothetical protein
MVGAQKTSDTRKAWIVLLLQEFLALFLSIHHHAAKFVNIEWFASQPDAFLSVDGRSSTNLDGQPAHQYQW